MKIYLHNEKSGWIIDEIAEDYKKISKLEIVDDPNKADICWCMTPFQINEIKTKAPIIVQVHHINEKQAVEYPFATIQKRAKAIITPNEITKKQLEGRTGLPVKVLPYWLLTSRMEQNKPWEIHGMLNGLKMIPNDKNQFTLIGSFQKDSNANGEAKYAKNPQMLVEVIKKCSENHRIRVVLTGYRRDFVVRHLQAVGIPFELRERVSVRELNVLYECCDWCFITSRWEGGPQAILEGAYRKVKTLSTRVGMAPEILHRSCICNNVEEMVKKFREGLDRTDYSKRNVLQNYMAGQVIPEYDKFFKNLI